MPEPILYFRGSDLLGKESRGFASPTFSKDARAVLTLGEQAVATLTEALKLYPGFLDTGNLAPIVREHVPDAKQANRVISFILNIERLCQQSGLPVEEFQKLVLAQMREQIAQGRSRPGGEPTDSLLTPDEIEELGRRIPRFLQASAALNRQWKAERLLHITGLPLEELQLICDLRPVFDDDRACVEGMFPVTTLKVVATGADGLPVALETRVSETQLEELHQKASLAILKLRTLREMLARKDIPLPIVQSAEEGE